MCVQYFITGYFTINLSMLTKIKKIWCFCHIFLNQSDFCCDSILNYVLCSQGEKLCNFYRVLVAVSLWVSVCVCVCGTQQ